MNRLSRPLRIVLALGVLGAAYAIAEGFVPSLRTGPSEEKRTACTEFAAAGSIAGVGALAKARNMPLSMAGPELVIRLGGGCVCALGVAQDRVEHRRVLCNS